MHQLLLHGHDTIESAYYLAPGKNCLLDYQRLAAEKEELRLSKSRKPTVIKLGCEEFMLASHGTRSGYPFLIENEAFSIQFGEFNKPSFFVIGTRQGSASPYSRSFAASSGGQLRRQRAGR